MSNLDPAVQAVLERGRQALEAKLSATENAEELKRAEAIKQYGGQWNELLACAQKVFGPLAPNLDDRLPDDFFGGSAWFTAVPFGHVKIRTQCKRAGPPSNSVFGGQSFLVESDWKPSEGGDASSKAPTAVWVTVETLAEALAVCERSEADRAACVAECARLAQEAEKQARTKVKEAKEVAKAVPPTGLALLKALADHLDYLLSAESK